MDRLLKNAVESIRVGVEDYETQEDVRSLSAVRNLHAGLLLLAKWVLVRSAPNASEDEVIRVAYEPEPNGQGGVKYVPGPGKQTIGLQDIHRRFERFGASRASRSAQDASYGAGAPAFFMLLEDWRSKGSLAGPARQRLAGPPRIHCSCSVL